MQNQKHDYFLLLIAVVCHVLPIVSAVEPVAALGSRMVVELLFVVGLLDAVKLVAVVVLIVLIASLQASHFSFFASFTSWVIFLLLFFSHSSQACYRRCITPPSAPRLTTLTTCGRPLISLGFGD
jgi:hypothetical protein